MTDNRTERLNLRLTPYEMELIEKHAKKEGMTPSEYGRVAILFDMVLSGNVEALKYTASQMSHKAASIIREKWESLAGESASTVKG